MMFAFHTKVCLVTPKQHTLVSQDTLYLLECVIQVRPLPKVVIWLDHNEFWITVNEAHEGRYLKVAVYMLSDFNQYLGCYVI